MEAYRSVHEANYSCIAENGVTNFISTPEFASIELIVQGTAKSFKIENDRSTNSLKYGLIVSSYSYNMHLIFYIYSPTHCGHSADEHSPGTGGRDCDTAV